MHCSRSSLCLKNVCALFSGGKDSTYALHWAFLKGFFVRCLVTLKPEREDSWMFHFPAVDVTKLQARAIGLPLIFKKTLGEKDKELEDLKQALMEAKTRYGIYGLVTGALLSDYQRMNINMIAHQLGLKVFSPLWRKNQEEYMRSLVRHGFKFIITSISVYGLGRNFLGKEIDEQAVEEILLRARKYGFNPAFEGGEAETLVLDAPLFKKKLRVKGSVVELGGYMWRYRVEEAWLEDK
ncbi:MAG: diphthine--ammonia ligase [Thermoprotei archaeon]|nr:MAG: diphthine--ammonia ligase [Thermoprotei archaeon]